MQCWCGVQLLQELVARHQAARALVTEDQVDAFMAVRPMDMLFGKEGMR